MNQIHDEVANIPSDIVKIQDAQEKVFNTLVVEEKSSGMQKSSLSNVMSGVG